MRVLTDVNHQTNQYEVRHKTTTEYESSEGRTANSALNISDCGPSTPAQLIQAAETQSDALPRRRSLRKFPGPAGILPPARPAEFSSVIRKSPDASSPQVLAHDSNRQEETVCSSQVGGEAFGGAAWRSLLSDLEPAVDDVLRKFSVQAMLHKAGRRLLPKGKVPLMLGVLDSMDFQGTDASVILRDPTGQMQGTLHREVFKDFSADLQPGAVIVLRQVSVISPSSRTHYLNITGGNIVAIYPATGNQTQPLLPSSLDQSMGAQSSQERMKNYIHAAEVELLEAANAAKESALNRLRRQSSAASNSPATPLAGGSTNERGPGLFGSTPRAGTPRLFAPPARARMAASSSSPQTPPGGEFRFRNYNPVRTPVPGARTPNPGMRTPGVNSGVMSYNASSGMETPTRNFHHRQQTPSARPSFLPRSSNTTALGGSGGGSNYSQGSGCRIQPPRPATPNSNQSHASSSIQSKTVTGNSSFSPTSTRFNSPAKGALTLSNTNSNHASIGNETVPSNSPSQFQANTSFENQLSQQSKWSFKRKSTDADALAVPSLVTNGINNILGNHQGEPPTKLKLTEEAGGEYSSTSVRLGVGGGGINAHGRSTVKSASAEKSGSMWDDDLSDDILSQLSDDF